MREKYRIPEQTRFSWQSNRETIMIKEKET